MADSPFNFLTEAGLGGYAKQKGLIKAPGGTLADPYNWKKIAADLKAEEANKRNSRDRIQAAATIKPAGQAAAPEEVAPAPTVKELLDAYRAMNNGALPVGTTAEMAAMIDKGIWTDWSMLEGNPQLAQALLSIQTAITGLPADYEAAKAGISANYANLTGDVLESGKNWMQDLYGRIVDPNDPNAALAQQDPALTNYANTMSQIEETGDLNEATDLAWFDKMLQNQLANYNFMQQSAAIPAPVEADGGGGGGGGGGRGRGGGGGGNGEWTDPKTTLTATDQLTDTLAETQNFYNPDLWAGLSASAQAQGGPEMEAAFYDLYTKYGQQPIPLQKGAIAEQTAAEEKLAELAQQDLLAQTYGAGLVQRDNPTDMRFNSAKNTMETWRNNMGMIPGSTVVNGKRVTTPGNPDPDDRWFTPENSPRYGAVATEEEKISNLAGQELERITNEMNLTKLAMLIAETKGMGRSNPTHKELNRKLTALGEEQLQVQRQHDIDVRTFKENEWGGTHDADEPFPSGTYPGYTPPVSPKQLEDTQYQARVAEAFRAALYGLDPNISAQTTNISGKLTDTQTDKASTTQSIKGQNVPTVNGNVNFPGQARNPNFMPLDQGTLPRDELRPGYYEDPNTGDLIDELTGMAVDTTTIGGGPTGKGFQVPTSIYNDRMGIQNAAKSKLKLKIPEFKPKVGKIGQTDAAMLDRVTTPTPTSAPVKTKPQVTKPVGIIKPKEPIESKRTKVKAIETVAPKVKTKTKEQILKTKTKALKPKKK